MSSSVNVTGPKTGRPATDFSANARSGWGEALPDWIMTLARECDASTATAVARRLGYSVAVVSAMVRGNYKGDPGAVEARVRGAYMGEIVECPVLGEIARDRCMREQACRHTGTSALRTKLRRACRGGCPHSRLAREARHAG